MTFKLSTDQDEIRTWVEEKGGVPAVTERTENQGRGILAIKFREEDVGLEEISWEEFFDSLTALNLAFRFETDGDEQGEFSYGFLDREQIAQEVEDENQTVTGDSEMPEDDIPVENLYPSAPELDIDTADSPRGNPDYPSLTQE